MDSTMLEKVNELIGGEVYGVWFLVGAALVFFMQCGFAMVETGFTRAKNAGNIIMKNLMDFCIGTIVFILIGFGLLLGENTFFGLIGKPDLQIFTNYADFDWSNFVFNLVFCATTATIVSGAMAERTKFISYCIYSGVLSAVIYPIEAHWIWGGGWLSQLGFHDFAGSCAIHMTGGLAALIGAAVEGARIGKFKRDKNGKVTKGEILYNGMDLAKFGSEKDWLKIRGKEVAMVFQDPMTSLNPLKTVGKQIQEALELHQNLHGSAARERTIEILSDVGITEPERRYKQYPHEFSGGMRQRAVIATAIACNPNILICDEPTTALDVTIQAQIIELLEQLQKKYRLTIIYITHDLGVVAKVADRIAVMYAGDIIEIGLCNEIFYNPQHPYTWALLSSLPQLGIKGEPLYSIHGTPPNLFKEIKGDAFAPRNPRALNIDYVIRPPYFEVSPTHYAKTWLLDPRSPKIEPPAIIQRLRDRWKEANPNV